MVRSLTFITLFLSTEERREYYFDVFYTQQSFIKLILYPVCQKMKYRFSLSC